MTSACMQQQVIMVLKKRKLNFLHVYHHCVVMPLFWGYMQSSMIIHWVLVVRLIHPKQSLSLLIRYHRLLTLPYFLLG